MSEQTQTSHEDRPSPFAFGAGLVVGWAVIAYGLWTMFHNKGLTNPKYTFELAFGSNIIHDAVFAPVLFVGAYIVRRVTPTWLRSTVSWALGASVVTLLVAYVPIRGFGRHADNPSVLPLNYATGTLTVLGTIWVIAIVIGIVQFVRRGQSAPTA